MISTQEALLRILSTTPAPKTETVILKDSLGKTLSEPALADRPGPPFDRVAMDGIASKLNTGLKKSYRIAGIQPAGAPAMELSAEEDCFEVMTGAPLPLGCDFVLPYESVTIDKGYATPIEGSELKLFQNVHKKGADFSDKEVLLQKGARIGPCELAILASLGYDKVKVWRPPNIAIVSTGDELVEIDQTPEAYQIRKSNIYGIQAMFARFGATPELFHLKDDLKKSQRLLEELVNTYDMLILSGGVSKGKFDFVPQALALAGIEKVFHGVKQRPGKPFFYGASPSCQVFGLPGNPVSSLVSLRKYVIPALIKRMGSTDTPLWFQLEANISKKTPYALFIPGKLIAGRQNGAKFTACKTNGSGDFAGLKGSEGFVELDEGERDWQMGEVVRFYYWER